MDFFYLFKIYIFKVRTVKVAKNQLKIYCFTFCINIFFSVRFLTPWIQIRIEADLDPYYMITTNTRIHITADRFHNWTIKKNSSFKINILLICSAKNDNVAQYCEE